MAALQTQHLTVRYDEMPILKGLDLEIPSGQITALVGPNGSGKSTLLRGLARLLKPQAGTVLLDGADIHALPTKALARKLGMLPQNPVAPEGITVRELVAQGRYPHQHWFQQWTAADEAAAQRALTLTNLRPLADRPVDTLSGGQRQRAWIALTLAQDTPIILLDEPTTFLDLAHQLEVLELLARLNTEGKTIVMVVHDLNHAAQCAQYVLALYAGQIVARGEPTAVITESLVREVFGVESRVIAHPVHGTPLCLPLGRAGG
jgi:iron complex transport system ATP-binding protein